MKYLILSLLLFTLNCQSVSSNSVATVSQEEESQGIVIEGANRYFYEIYKDSLYSWGSRVPYKDGSLPQANKIITPTTIHPTYAIEDIPTPIAWVLRLNIKEGVFEECKLIAETLYCPDDTGFIDWRVVCKGEEF